MKYTYIYKFYKHRKIKFLNQKIDIAGIIYNHCIALHRTHYRIFKKHLDKYKLQKHLAKLKEKEKHSFWILLGSQAVQDITDRIDRSYKLFYRNLKKNIKSSHPGFKKVKKYKSFTLKQAGYKLLEGNKIRIGKKVYKFAKSREINGQIKTLTIKRDILGDLYLIMTLEIHKTVKKNITTGKIAGFDFGIKTFLSVSNHEKIESPFFYKQCSKKIAKANKALARKKNKSNRRKKAKIALAKIYKYLGNSRKNYFFQLAHVLVDKYDYLIFEDLNIKAMQLYWGKKISDISFHTFLKVLEHVANKKGKTLHKIDRFFPSSKMCSHCTNINENLSLKDRLWTCPHCSKELDRDNNAAINILREGASSLSLDIVRLENSSEYCWKLESNVL
jgi:putative transposase